MSPTNWFLRQNFARISFIDAKSLHLRQSQYKSFIEFFLGNFFIKSPLKQSPLFWIKQKKYPLVWLWDFIFLFFLQGPTLIGPSPKKKNIIGNIRHAADSNTEKHWKAAFQLHQLLVSETSLSLSLSLSHKGLQFALFGKWNVWKC
jgi:hypothetical protein